VSPVATAELGITSVVDPGVSVGLAPSEVPCGTLGGVAAGTGTGTDAGDEVDVEVDPPATVSPGSVAAVAGASSPP